MNKFTMKQVKLSKTADLKIKVKLFILQLQKDFQWLKLLKLAIPTMALAVIATLWVSQFINTDTTSTQNLAKTDVSSAQSGLVKQIWEVRGNTYKARAKKRAYTQKANHYKQYAYLRSAQLRAK